MSDVQARILVFSSLFPYAGQPTAGLFIRERMFRVGQRVPLVVVAPAPWFPGQSLLRRWRPHFRPPAPRWEMQDGFEVYRPRFLSVPSVFKWLDGLFMALGSFVAAWRLRRRFGFNVIDAHFAYPDGYAASLLGRWLGLPVTITLRGTEVPIARDRIRRRLMLSALRRARRVFAVADSLKTHVAEMGADPEKIKVVANGVDSERFAPVLKSEARRQLDLPSSASVLITVGALVERKGFHRVLEVLPRLRRRHPGLHYLIVGGGGPEGDWGERLRHRADALGLHGAVRFLGPVAPKELKVPLSAADVFVLATTNEGWANVFLEAMACGLPVVTTRVGGNAEVVASDELGFLVPAHEPSALEAALDAALSRRWDHAAIRSYACRNSWTQRVTTLVEEFNRLVQQRQEASEKLGLTETGAPTDAGSANR